MKPTSHESIPDAVPLKRGPSNGTGGLTPRGSIGARLHIPKKSPYASTFRKSIEASEFQALVENAANEVMKQEEETKEDDAISHNTVLMEVLKYRTSTKKAPPLENMKLDTTRVKSESDIEFIKKSMKMHFIFYNSSMSEMEAIAEKMQYFTANKGEYIFKQGDDAMHFFIIEKGDVEVYVNDHLRRTLISSEGFGELALLYNAPRSASIKATSDCGFWAIDRKTFKKAIKDIMSRQYDENYKFIKECPLFDNLTQAQKEAISSFAIVSKYTKGQNVFIEGDQATSFHIIIEGGAMGFKEFKEVQKLVKGDHFGEEALFHDSPQRIMTIKAITPILKCITMSRDALQSTLGSELLMIIYRNLQRSALLKSKLFKKLTDLQLEKVADAMEICNFSDGEVVFPKGVSTTAMVIIMLEGSLKKKTTGATVVKKGECYGDQFFLDDKAPKEYDDDIVVDSQAVISFIQGNPIKKIFGLTLHEITSKNRKSEEHKATTRAKVLEAKDRARSYRLVDMIYYKTLGSGHFAKVYLVRDKNFPYLFALKCVSKDQIIEERLENIIQSEKKVLEKIDSPFMVYFIRTFKDENHIYFLTEYIRGLDLHTVSKKLGKMEKSKVQFYISQLILAIEYLHSLDIIYRDLKPGNTMVDETVTLSFFAKGFLIHLLNNQKGYLRLVDMGTAKFMNENRTKIVRTYTVIGTPHFMAPEIVSGKGYGKPVDLWAIGVTMYKFLTGNYPFGNSCEDPQQVFEEILQKPLQFPGSLRDSAGIALVKHLLNKTPELRLGESYSKLKTHPWFDSFDWDKLQDKGYPPPYIPEGESIISSEEIKKREAEATPIIAHINSQPKAIEKTTRKPKNPNWDEIF